MSKSKIQDGLTESSFHPKIWGVAVILIILVSSLLYVTDKFMLVSVNPELSEIGADVFLKYLFIVVAVERAAAVFVGMSRSQNKVDWSLRINRLNEILNKEDPKLDVLKQVYSREHRLITELQNSETISKIEDVQDVASSEEYIGYLTSAKHAYEFQKARFNSVTNKYVARIVFFAGIVLAAMGLSIFQDLIDQVKLEK